MDGNVSEIAFYVCYLFIVILIITSYTDIIGICEETIHQLGDFMNILIPLILALLVANGNIATVGMLKPVLLVMISFINVIVSKFILPVLFISAMVELVSNITENIDVSKLPQFMQKFCMWGLELMIVIFVGILSVEGTLAANVDGVTAKGAKAVVSTVIPVVGKALSDATDSILGAASITKNAIGVLGVIVILSISLVPLIKVLVMMLIFQVGSALVEPVVDKRISKCMANIGESMKMIVGVMATTSVLFMIATTLMMKIGNS
ncbi:MAG: stage III sporulation protein AE [Clostridia bacterium]|nr:stage III sporulation protein AE [Clostridia bacterium]